MAAVTTAGLGTNGVDAAYAYQPPTVRVIVRGNSIENGQYQFIPAGEQIALTGVYQLANGSGQLQATGEVRYRVVTITTP